MNTDKLFALERDVSAGFETLQNLQSEINELRQERNRWNGRMTDIRRTEPDEILGRDEHGAWAKVPTTPSGAKRQATSEIARISKRIDRLEGEIERVRAKHTPSAALLSRVQEYIRAHRLDVDPNLVGNHTHSLATPTEGTPFGGQKR